MKLFIFAIMMTAVQCADRKPNVDTKPQKGYEPIEYCPGGHDLKQCTTSTTHNVGCDVCGNELPGFSMYGCRKCNWDACPRCWKAGMKATRKFAQCADLRKQRFDRLKREMQKSEIKPARITVFHNETKLTFQVWRETDEVDVYSQSKRTWCRGQVLDILADDMCIVEYETPDKRLCRKPMTFASQCLKQLLPRIFNSKDKADFAKAAILRYNA